MLFEGGEIRAEFQEAYDSIDLWRAQLGNICQSCFSGNNTKRFRDVSLGLVDMPSYSEVRDKALEDVSSDGDSVVSTYSC